MKQAFCVGCSIFALAFGLGLDPAYGGATNEYRIVGCSPTDPTTFPPTLPNPFKVTFSSVPDDIGLDCEVVLNALGADGFKLIELRDEAVSVFFERGTFHYLERADSDD